MVELVDTQVLEACALRRAGSSPARGTLVIAAYANPLRPIPVRSQ